MAAEEAGVVIAGGGPAGLMLAAELMLGGTEPVVLERLTEISEIPKGNGLVGQIVPVLDYRGLLDPIRAEATFAGPIPAFSFGPLRLDFSGLGAMGGSPLHIAAIPQRRLERLLGERLAELGGSIRRGHELTALVPDEDGVTLEVRGPDGGYSLRAGYLVGCEGAHSLVRKQAGIGFPGITSSEISRIGRVFLPTAVIAPGGAAVEVPGAGRLTFPGVVRTPRGAYSMMPLAILDRSAPPGLFIVFTSEEDPTATAAGDGPMTLDELRASFRRVLGADLEMTEPQWLTRTVGNSRQAERYRADRVLLAGDAAHVFGAGGSLNVGLLDAVNLGWKLAAQVEGRAPDGLLDSYNAERYLAGQRALLQTRAQKALGAADEGTAAIRELFGELLRYPEALRHLGEAIQGSDVRYPMPGAGARLHRLAGYLAPDLRVEVSDGRPTRVAELLRPARGVLLDLTPDAAVTGYAAGWADRITVLAARALSTPAVADALLIRPDGYVAWAAGPGAPEPAHGLEEALRTWFGDRQDADHACLARPGDQEALSRIVSTA
jgi:2-polyprenyl-6-methoxyphenol hydroxylase-like FAD-dependent oxidoreductase